MMQPVALTQEAYLYSLSTIAYPTINYRRTAFFGLSVVDFWAAAYSLFMMAAPMMGWIHYETPSLASAFWFGGLCEYIHGFYNWYQGRTILSLINWLYGLLHWVFFYTAELGKYQIYVPPEYHTYMQGTFYIFWLIIMLVLLIALKDRGLIYMWNFFLLVLALIFIIVWEFSKRSWARKVAGYLIFIACIFIWLTGLGRLICELFHCSTLPGIYPYL